MARPFWRRFFSRSNLIGYLFIGPWIVGFVWFTLGPFVASIVISFMDWDLVTPAQWIGAGNYVELFANDDLFLPALYNTTYYTVFHVPGVQVVALALALLLNQRLRAISIYRTIFYLPSVTSGVATAFLWAQLFNFHSGLINVTLDKVGITGPQWFADPTWAKPALIIMSWWSVGGAMIIYLAGLQGVPQSLHEAAAVDGAGRWARFRHVTIPMLTPVIFYNLVIGIIGSFQVFTAAYVITQGGPVNSTLFYVLYLYFRAFRDFKMGIASAMAWILFLVILVFTLIQLFLARRWVYYEGAGARGGLV